MESQDKDLEKKEEFDSTNEAEYEEANAEFVQLIETALNFAKEQGLSDEDVIGGVQNGLDDCTSMIVTLKKAKDIG